jgi:hypothetical protein
MKTADVLVVSSEAASTSQLVWLLVGDVADILDDGLDVENLRWLLPVLESLLQLMNTEEQQDGTGGYMNDVLEVSPNSFDHVLRLHGIRNALREELQEMIGRIRQTPLLESLPAYAESFAARSMSVRLLSWVDRLSTHHRAERLLCQSVWYTELGGGD